MPDIRTFETADAPHDLLTRVRTFVVDAFDGAFSDEDWNHSLGGWHVVVEDEGQPVAHAAVIERVLEVDGRPFHTGYLEGVATHPSKDGQGLGSLAVGEVTALVRAKFEMGGLSTDRHNFYARLGWERWLGPSFVRDGAEMVRTEDEDDGVMVLRFGPSATVDLTSSISCERRSGDDW